MRTAEDEGPLSTRRLRDLLIGLLVVIAVVGGIFPWLALADAWQRIGRDYVFIDAETDRIPRLVFAVQELPYISLQADSPDVLAMAAAVGVILLAGQRFRGSDGGMRWSPAHVITAVAVVSALLAALLRLGVRAYTLLGVMDARFDQFLMTASGTTGSLLALLAPAVGVLAWIAVLVAGLLYRPGAPDTELAAEQTEPVDEQTVDDGHEGTGEQRRSPAPHLGPADIRPDGASDSGYDEFRF